MTTDEYAKYHTRYPYQDGDVTHVCRLSLLEYVELHETIYKTASKNGCKPFWCDGIIGWGWHCGCVQLTHACDQQCSAITMGSAHRRDKKR
jgi:hypothetical protein